MKTLHFEYHVPSSQRPDWLLLFVSLAQSYFKGEYRQDEQPTTLNSLSELLDEQTIIQRKLRRSGKNISRDIINNSEMAVYSSTGQRRYLTISFIDAK